MKYEREKEKEREKKFVDNKNCRTFYWTVHPFHETFLNIFFSRQPNIRS